MGVIKLITGDYQPICNSCGVALCWNISMYDYENEDGLAKNYFDEWSCNDCDPQYQIRWNQSRRRLLIETKESLKLCQKIVGKQETSI